MYLGVNNILKYKTTSKATTNDQKE